MRCGAPRQQQRPRLRVRLTLRLCECAIVFCLPSPHSPTRGMSRVGAHAAELPMSRAKHCAHARILAGPPLLNLGRRRRPRERRRGGGRRARTRRAAAAGACDAAARAAAARRAAGRAAGLNGRGAPAQRCGAPSPGRLARPLGAKRWADDATRSRDGKSSAWANMSVSVPAGLPAP